MESRYQLQILQRSTKSTHSLCRSFEDDHCTTVKREKKRECHLCTLFAGFLTGEQTQVAQHIHKLVS